MLTSLFGDLDPLGSRKDAGGKPMRATLRPAARDGADFAATAILERACLG